MLVSSVAVVVAAASRARRLADAGSGRALPAAATFVYTATVSLPTAYVTPAVQSAAVAVAGMSPAQLSAMLSTTMSSLSSYGAAPSGATVTANNQDCSAASTACFTASGTGGGAAAPANVGAIAGGVVGGVVAAALIAGVAVLVVQRRRARTRLVGAAPRGVPRKASRNSGAGPAGSSGDADFGVKNPAHRLVQ